MKKILTLLICIVSLQTISAQDTTRVSLETQFDLFSKSNTAVNGIKFRYFLSPKHVLRTNWTFDFASNTTEILEVDGEGVGSIEEIDNSNSFSLGYEHHFTQDRFSPYLGAEAIIGFGKSEVYGSRTDGSVFVNDFNYSEKQNTTAFGVHFFTGFDVLIYRGLFLGSEIGLNFTSSNTKRGAIETQDASSTTNATTSTPIPGNQTSYFKVVNMGIIRLGWKF